VRYITRWFAAAPGAATTFPSQANGTSDQQGDGVARNHALDQIVIYRDTLLRDFGHDPERLSLEVDRTLRHEIAHHLGWSEPGVAGLGL
jgi:predicted Zn-dependent protease with MMP-like domain